MILWTDPYSSRRASISHTNDWFVLVPIFHSGDLVGWSASSSAT